MKDSQRKVHLYHNNTQGTACCPSYRLDDELRDLTVDDDIARWCAFIALPRKAQCDTCADWIASAEACEWLALGEDYESHATKHHVLSVSLFCGALAGALDPILRLLVAEVCAAQSDGERGGASGVLLDTAEQRGLDAEDAWPFTLVDGIRVPVRYQTWLDVDKHGDPRGNNPHAWLPVRVNNKATAQRRCPCGLYEHEWRRFVKEGRLAYSYGMGAARLAERLGLTQSTVDALIQHEAGAPRFICPDCGTAHRTWTPRCSSCHSMRGLSRSNFTQQRTSTGLPSLDHVLGGGLMEGSTILLAAGRGTGVTMLTLQVLAGLGQRCLYVAGEGTREHVAATIRRVGAVSNQLHVLVERNLDEILAQARRLRARTIAIDPLRSVRCGDISLGPSRHIQEVVSRLVRYAKETQTTLWLTGNLTGSGDIAGPRTLQHDVDVVLELDQGPRFDGNERIVRCSNKNRFGPTDVAGHFELSAQGFLSVEEEMLDYFDRVERA